MLGNRLVAGVVLLSTFALAGTANGYYFDIWPTTADGSMDLVGMTSAPPNGEGYSIAGAGNFRFSKSTQQMSFMGFGQVPGSASSGYSDGPDKIPQGRVKGGVNDKGDGVLMANWLVGKKAFHAVIYLRDASTQTCDPHAADGAFINDPVTILGFRVANNGPFVDYGTGAKGTAAPPSGFSGCCAGYVSPLLEGGENAPPAWRMGKPYVNRAGVLGYSQCGDVNEGDAQHEYYKVSVVDTKIGHAGQEVKAADAWFAGGNGYGGYAAGLTRFAFGWLVANSDAMIVNSGQLREADCTGFAGEEEPRDFAGDGDFAEGWFAKKIDRSIINALVTPNDQTGIIECKGLVFTSVPATPDPSIFGRDQGSGLYGPYLAITATIDGDVDNDGSCDVVDLLYLVDAFGSAVGDANFNSESDFNCDGYVDVVDLLTMVEQFGNSVP